MPAHRAISAIGVALESDGKLLSGADWRATNLADLLAKQVVSAAAPPPGVTILPSYYPACPAESIFLGKSETTLGAG